MDTAPPVPVVVVVLATFTAAVMDLWKLRVYNALTLPLLASGLIFHGVAGGTAGLVASVLGALFGFGVLIALYLVGGMGGGDVKLMAGVGAWLCMPLTFWVFIASSLAAGIYALLLMVFYRQGRESWVNFQIIWYRLAAVGRHLGAEDGVESSVSRLDRRRVVPFASMIALGLAGLIVGAWVALGH
jgi:prepilin peptidase CpaA